MDTVHKATMRCRIDAATMRVGSHMVILYEKAKPIIRISLGAFSYRWCPISEERKFGRKGVLCTHNKLSCAHWPPGKDSQFPLYGCAMDNIDNAKTFDLINGALMLNAQKQFSPLFLLTVAGSYVSARWRYKLTI